MHQNIKDLGAGLIFAAIGVVYGSIAWFKLPVGRALNMGPGYFPIVLALILICLGAAIMIGSFKKPQASPFGKVPWRGVILLSAAIIFFATFIEEVGMLPGVFVTTFLAAMSKKGVAPHHAAMTGIGVAIFCTLIFAYGVRLPIPVIGEIFNF